MRWKPVPGWPLYEVSDTGLIRNVKSGHIKSQRLNNNGYMRVQLSRDNHNYPKFVHLLVLESFIGPRPFSSWEGSHLDGNRTNNVLTNLMWKSKSDNELDRVSHGTSNQGSRHGMSKLRETDVVEIRSLYANGSDTYTLSKKYNISRATIRDIIRRITWRHL